MGDLVGEDRLGLFLAHGAQQAVLTATSELSRRAPVAKAFRSGESQIATSGRADAGLIGETVRRLHDPALGVVAGLFDDLSARRPLGDGLRHGERDERTAEADDERDDEQPHVSRGVETEGAGRDAQHDAEQGHDRQVGADQEKYALAHV